MVNQNCSRLPTYRLDGHKQKFEPAAFSIFLISIATGALVQTHKISDLFTPTLQPRDSKLTADKEGYLVMIDSNWMKLPKQQDLRQQYFSINLSVYCPG